MMREYGRIKARWWASFPNSAQGGGRTARSLPTVRSDGLPFSEPSGQTPLGARDKERGQVALRHCGPTDALVFRSPAIFRRQEEACGARLPPSGDVRRGLCRGDPKAIRELRPYCPRGQDWGRMKLAKLDRTALGHEV